MAKIGSNGKNTLYFTCMQHGMSQSLIVLLYPTCRNFPKASILERFVESCAPPPPPEDLFLFLQHNSEYAHI